jgi:quercetin dioxygenase-like cupin family protein
MTTITLHFLKFRTIMRMVQNHATLTILSFVLVTGFLAVGTVFATPGSGVTASGRVVSSNANIFVNAPGNGMLMLMFGESSRKSDPVNLLNVHNTFAPGGFSGWHTHAGPGIVIVEQGTITIENTEGCFIDYPQGSVLFEGGPGHVHNASNRTSTPVILDSYFFLPAFDPAGGNSRIDEPIQVGPCEN